MVVMQRISWLKDWLKSRSICSYLPRLRWRLILRALRSFASSWPERFEEVNAFDDVRARVDALSALARQLQETSDGRGVDSDTLASLEELLEDSDDDLSLLERWKASDTEESQELRAQLISRLSERHGLADYVVRNRRGPVGGMPKRVPHLIPLEPTELQDILIDTGESVVLELADDIEDEAKRYNQMGKMLRALWSTPGAILEIARSISPVLDQQLRPHVLEVTQAPKDEKGLPTGVLVCVGW